MTHNLQPGDRIRVATNAAISGCQPGDKGTVLTGPILRGGGGLYYVVALDKRGADSTSMILKAEQIEPDM